MSDNGPADFGLGAAATLSHVADQALPDLYSRAWAEWRDVLEDHPAQDLVAGSPAIVGFGGESVPVRVTMPVGELRGVLVEASDAENVWRKVNLLTAMGLGVVQVGLRGCSVGTPPTSDWGREGLGEGFDKGDEAIRWRVMRAAGDVAAAVLASSRLGVPVYGRGRSLGGGLMVLALAGLGSQVNVERLVLELPGLGDWKWRWAMAAKASVSGSRSPAAAILDAERGVGGGLLAHASRLPARRQQLYNSLRLIDSALAAPKLKGPTLCKLAVRDEVVPAPTAAAVFNALGSDTGHKWRFVVPMGHYEGDSANTRRHAEFERCAREFLDPAHSPAAAMKPWFDGGERPAEAVGSLFGESASAGDESELGRAYQRAGRTLDDLPYTAEFDRLYESVSEGGRPTRRDVLHELQRLRKAGKLPRLGKATTPPPSIDREHEAMLEGLVVERLGKLSLRDRLPYTPEFDTIVAEFNAGVGLSLEPHEVWRLIAKLAK